MPLLWLSLILIPFLPTPARGQPAPVPPGPELWEFDGTLGLVPEIFEEEDDSNINLYAGDSIKEFLKICEGVPDDMCINCPNVFRNSFDLKLSPQKGHCDRLSWYNFKKLRLAQEHVKTKSSLVADYLGAAIYLILYFLCVAVGIYLLIVRQFRLRTLWDKYAHDPTQGIRSFRYERMQFKFDYEDPGASPENLKGYEDWELYHSSEDEDHSKHYHTTGNIGFEQTTLGRKKQLEREKGDREKGSKSWPWEHPDYDFSKIPYREGLRKDMDDWRDDEDYNFSSNI